MAGKVGKAGWFPSAKYEGDQDHPAGVSVASVAAQNEYGNPAKNIPARPFFRPTIVAKQKEWTALIGRGAIAVLEGHTDAQSVILQVSMLAAAQIAETITKIWRPRLAASTVARRKAKLAKGTKITGAINKPLVETGHMFNTISGVVEDA